MSLFKDRYQAILNNLIANYTNIVGVNINKKSAIYGLINGFAKEQTLQRLYNEDKLQKKILIERQSLEEARETGSLIGLEYPPATSATGYAVIQGTAGDIPATTEFTNGTYTYKVLQDTSIAQAEQYIVSLSRNGSIAIAKTSISHNLGSGTVITISGANEANFNVIETPISVISNDEFTYIVPDSGATIATGSPKYTVNMALLNLLCNQTGDGTNLLNGEILNITSTIEGINNFCIININGLTGGTDEESLISYKTRLSTQFANNTNDYASSLIENTLKNQFPTIAQVLLVKYFSYPIKISTIRKLTNNEKLLYPEFDNGTFRVVETADPHNISRVLYPIKINGSIESSLNIPTGLAPYTNTWAILDIDKIIIYVGNTTIEDLVCTNTYLVPYSYSSCLFILKKGDNKYPTANEITSYYNHINDEILPFTDADYYTVASFQKVTIDFEISNIIPDNVGIKNAISANIYDYFNNYVKGGQTISRSKYENIIYQSQSGIYKLESASIICKANNNIVTDIDLQVYEYPHINNVTIL